MTDQPNYDKILSPLDDVTTSVETLLEGAFGRLMGDQREGLKRVHASAWALHTLVLEVVTNIGIENIAKRAYLPKKFDDYIAPIENNSRDLMQGLDGPLNEEQRIAVEFIHVTGQLMRRYMNNLLLYSQLSNDLYPMEKQLTAIDTLVDPMQWSVTTHPVELEVFVPENLPRLRVDATLIQAAIMQIVENAVNNTQSGSIRIVVEVEGVMMTVTVIDTGCGIPSSQSQQIFKPFFQINPDELGLGLGLPIAQKTMLMHQGIVQIESTKAGTSVLMRFPIL